MIFLVNFSDSYYASQSSQSLDDCVLPEMEQSWSEVKKRIFEDPDSKITQAGKSGL